MTLKRYRVRATQNTYADDGPDLLRPPQNAVQQFARAMGPAKSGWYWRKNPAGEDSPWTDWRGPMNRAAALQAANAFLGSGHGAKLQAGRVRDGKVNAKAEMLAQVIPQVALPGTNPGARLVADLTRFQFKANVGGFNCREYNGIKGSGWSDHAWGDAVDLSVGGGSPGKNDTLTDWCVRMARAGCMSEAAQFIGSRGGRVYSFVSPSYAPNLGGPSSHLTHVHCSYKQHFGRDPNCR